MRIHVGTSGFVYRDWRGVFYPPDVPARRWLDYYSSVFSTVEMNTTFYRLPSREATATWQETTPRNFVFACKGSRFLTHMKRLLDTGEGVRRFFDRIEPLGRKLRVVLWQLPPQWSRPDPERLDRFLAALPRDVRHAVEFRHPAWYTDEICDVLDRHRAAFCEHDLVGERPPRVTGRLRYLRFHGAGATQKSNPYGGRYGRRRLDRAARDLAAFGEAGGEAFVYFNNDRGGAAVVDAMDLTALLAEYSGTSVEPAHP